MSEQPRRPVPLADAEIAQRIAAAARSGRRADREPALEHLLAAFGEAHDSAQARERVAAALAVVGLRTDPEIAQARIGGRVRLRAAAPPRRGRALAGIVLLVALLAGVALAASLLRDNHDKRAGDDLPDTSVTQPPTTATTPPTTTTTTAKKPPAKKKQQRKPRRKPKRHRVVSQRLTVHLDPGPRPSFLCFDHGPGTPEQGLTLASPLTLHGDHIRLNIGLQTVQVTIDGKPFPISGSPTGYDLTKKAKLPLALGQRPCG